ncbi:MAG: hypothetical protein ABI743_04170, partial [bacterium]
MRPIIALMACGGFVLTLAGCQGGRSSEGIVDPSPEAVPVSTSGSSALGTPMQRRDAYTSALALYTLTIDPKSLAASAALRETRAAQQNDDLYLLPIDRFLDADSFLVTGVSGTATTLDVRYVVKHPFPGPANLTGTPNASTNRADLGVTGFVLFLTDVSTATGKTYFPDRVVNTAVIANPDAYFAPGELLTLSGMTANTFPYLQLVDELVAGTGSRQGLSNGGTVTGNFGADGWTRTELGVNHDGWTGYGVLHQGQSSERTLSLRKSSLTAGYRLDVAIVAKYNDPRGGANSKEKRGNRLPPATPDAALFAYRMPHGALDVGSVALVQQDGAFVANTVSGATFHATVDDWDARATETTATDLSLDPAFDTVAVGESGLPTLEVCIPGIVGGVAAVATLNLSDNDTVIGGDAAADSGHPGDALYYTAVVTNATVSGQLAGTYTGMLRATDPEADLVTGLDADLVPLTTTPPAVTYQSFTTAVTSTNNAPTATVSLTSADPLLSATAASLNISSIADAENNPVDVRVDWGLGGGFVTVASGLNNPYPVQTPTGPVNINVDLVPDSINLTVRIQDGFGFTDYPLGYLLGPNRPPQVTGTPSLASNSVNSPATFSMTAGTATATDPEGDTISYTIVNNRNADVVPCPSFPHAANTTALTNPPNVSVQFTTYASDPLHGGAGGTVYPVALGAILLATPGAWVYTPASTSFTFASGEYAYDVLVDPAQNVWVLGVWGTGTPGIDFGGGVRAPGTGTPMFLLKLDGPTGAWMLDRVWNSTGTTQDRPYAVATDLDGNIYASMIWSTTLAIAGLGSGATDQVTGGGPSTGEYTILKFSPTGTFLGLVRSNDTAGTSVANPPTSISGASAMGVGSQGLAIEPFSGALYGIVAVSGGAMQNYGGTTVAPVGGGANAVVLRYETTAFNVAGTGAATWAINLSPAGGTEWPIAVALDPSGNVLLGGAFDG